MKVIQRFLFLSTFIILMNFQISGFGQAPEQLNIMSFDIEKLLPPLSKIIDTALKISPSIRYSDLQISINKSSYKAKQLEWTRNLGLQADARYGTFDNFSSNLSSSSASTTMIATRNNQLNYGVGASLRLPIYEYLNRKNQNSGARDLIEQSEALAESQRSVLRQSIIKQYNDLILKQKLLKMKSKYIETARINYEMLEKQFQNGQITIDEYSRISDTVVRTEIEFESAKIDLVTSYMIFEEVVGVKFNLSNSINSFK